MIDFGETVHLLIDNIFNISNKDDKEKFYSYPTLAFQCKIAKIRSVLHGQLESNWSAEANSVFINHAMYTKQLRGTVS